MLARSLATWQRVSSGYPRRSRTDRSLVSNHSLQCCYQCLREVGQLGKGCQVVIKDAAGRTEAWYLIITYSAVINACAKSGDLAKDVEWLSKVEEEAEWLFIVRARHNGQDSSDQATAL